MAVRPLLTFQAELDYTLEPTLLAEGSAPRPRVGLVSEPCREGRTEAAVSLSKLKQSGLRLRPLVAQRSNIV
jgi:hypothetical protein